MIVAAAHSCKSYPNPNLSPILSPDPNLALTSTLSQTLTLTLFRTLALTLALTLTLLPISPQSNRKEAVTFVEVLLELSQGLGQASASCLHVHHVCMSCDWVKLRPQIGVTSHVLPMPNP